MPFQASRCPGLCRSRITALLVGFVFCFALLHQITVLACHRMRHESFADARSRADLILDGNIILGYDYTYDFDTTFSRLQADLEVITTKVAPVPLPPALPLFAGGLGLMGWLARRKRRQATHA